ncbi:MAG: Rrf2 family transcriptional regulator [Acidobacteriaceae bacterium]|jgi:Rrf2 family protein
MLRLTKKADYGLMALKFLAEHPDQSVSARDIAQAYHIPPQLLAKVLQRLAKVAILRSHAGMSGGYSLLKHPREISAFEVIHAIDGPLFITSCGTDDHSCDLTDSCTIKEPLARVNDSISGLLRSISIADLAEPSADHARPKSLQELVTIRM